MRERERVKDEVGGGLGRQEEEEGRGKKDKRNEERVEEFGMETEVLEEGQAVSSGQRCKQTGSLK